MNTTFATSQDMAEVAESEDAGGSAVLNQVRDSYGRHNYDGYGRAFIEKPDGSRMVFITLTSTGIKREGEPFGGYYLTPELALDALDKEIHAYVEEKVGHIHWRKRPTAHPVKFFETVYDNQLSELTLWVASCRLAVDPYEPSND